MSLEVSNTFGRSVKLVRDKIRQSLHDTCEGIAHVFAHYPAMVCIGRVKEKGKWTIGIEELSDDDVEGNPLIPIYYVEFADEDIEEAITLFLELVKSPRKDFEKYMYKKLGKSIILSPSPRIIPPGVDAQTYLYEVFRESVKRSLSRKKRSRRARSAGSP
jgi:hypothetical protein